MSTEATPETPPPPKPHFLRRVRIRNYKSIAFCDVRLEPLTILVGRNATGKSNFLDALGFLSDVVVKGVHEAVKLHGGRNAVLCRTSGTSFVSIEIEAVYVSPNSTKSWSVKYSLEIALPANSAPMLIKEKASFYKSAYDHLVSYEVSSGRVQWIEGVVSSHFSEWLNIDRAFLITCQGINPFHQLYSNIERLAFYSFSPETLRLPQISTNGWYLGRNGANLASVYKSTLDADPAAAKRTARYLNAIAHSVEFAGVLSAGGYEILEFDTSRNVDAWNGPLRDPDRFSALSMSDGTLRAFAAVMAAFQTVNPYGSPSLVAIEEPETALHPAAMRALVAALDEATWRTQILITTHSPDLLDAEEVKPANVRVVQLVDGHTVIGPVDEANVEIVKRELNTLAGLERENQLMPDLDDQDRQQTLKLQESGVHA